MDSCLVVPKVCINSLSLLLSLFPPGVLAQLAKSRSGDETSEILVSTGGLGIGDLSNNLGDRMNLDGAAEEVLDSSKMLENPDLSMETSTSLM